MNPVSYARSERLFTDSGVDGKFLGLRVEFTLDSSQYATMALREVTRYDTSSARQAELVHS